MQLVSKLFLAFWALIAVAHFASGATTYSGLKDVAKITVGVTGVALSTIDFQAGSTDVLGSERAGW